MIRLTSAFCTRYGVIKSKHACLFSWGSYGWHAVQHNRASGPRLRQARARTHSAEEALRRARSAFRDVLEERFEDWSLTPAERDVALFAIKGFSTQDMALLRGVSEGTIKAQTAAIYRKAGVTGRPQLLSLFIDELVEGEDQSSQA